MTQSNPSDPFKIILDQVANFIEIAGKKSAEKFNEDPLMPSIEKQLDLLEDFIKKMGKDADEELKKKSISNEKLAHLIIKERDKLNKTDKQTVEKSLNLQKGLFSLKYALTMAKLKLKEPESKQFDSKQAKASLAKKRKSKFKKAQGNKTWKKI